MLCLSKFLDQQAYWTAAYLQVCDIRRQNIILFWQGAVSAVAFVIAKTPSMIILGSGGQALIQRTHLERIRGPTLTFKTYFRQDVVLHNLLSSRGSDYSKVVLLSQQLGMLYQSETFQVQSHWPTLPKGSFHVWGHLKRLQHHIWWYRKRKKG